MDFVSTNLAGFPSVTRVSYVGGTGGVRGMALLEDQLFVTRYSTYQVSVHNTMTLQQMRAFTVPGLSNNASGAGMVADAINNLLYIADWSNSQVQRVNLSMTSNSSVLTWNLYHPYGVSLTRAGNILVQIGQNMIIEYNPSGSPTGRSITDSNCLNHAVEVENGIWAVSRCGPGHGIAMNTSRVTYKYI